ncbi:hypothetical protein KBA27_01540 [bacterium]|nr:hypothetical protein [bacterium]
MKTLALNGVSFGQKLESPAQITKTIVKETTTAEKEEYSRLRRYASKGMMAMAIAGMLTAGTMAMTSCSKTDDIEEVSTATTLPQKNIINMLTVLGIKPTVKGSNSQFGKITEFEFNDADSYSVEYFRKKYVLDASDDKKSVYNVYEDGQLAQKRTFVAVGNTLVATTKDLYTGNTWSNTYKVDGDKVYEDDHYYKAGVNSTIIVGYSKDGSIAKGLGDCSAIAQ